MNLDFGALARPNLTSFRKRTVNNITAFLEEALAYNDRAMTYRVTTRLNELFPDQCVLGCWDTLDIEGFVRYAQGEADLTSRLVHEVVASWNSQKDRMERKLVTSWIELTWKGEQFQVIRVLKNHSYHHWLIGPHHAIDRFAEAILRFSHPKGPRSFVYDGWWVESPRHDLQIEKTSWDELILPPKRKSALESHAIGFFDAKEHYDRMGIAWKRGIILVGPPGNGKTLAIRAILNRLNVPRLFVKTFGDEASDVEDIFDKVAELAPCVVVCEDLDNIIKPGLLSAVLNHLDGVQQLSGVLILATTNNPEKLDPAIRNRPSRFDRVIDFSQPSIKERELLLRRFFEKCDHKHGMKRSQYCELAKATEGFSCAYLKELAVSSVFAWNANRCTTSLFDEAVAVVQELRLQMTQAQTTPSQIDLVRTRKEFGDGFF